MKSRPYTAVLLTLALAACGGEPLPSILQVRDLEGLPVEIEARDDDPQRASAAVATAFEEAERLAGLLLAERQASQIDLLNRIPSGLEIEIAPEAAAALRTALAIAEATDGAYDPALPPLLRLWGIGTDTPHVPSPSDLDFALRRVDWRDIGVADESPDAQRLSRRTEIDLADVGRGAIADGALAVLRRADVPAARVSIGALHALYGGRRSQPWEIAVASGDDPDAPVASVRLRAGGLATVSPRIEHVTEDGLRLHARIDPRDGRPSQATRLVTVTAPSTARAAGLAAAFFVMGDDARERIGGSNDVEGLVWPREGARWRSSGIEADWR